MLMRSFQKMLEATMVLVYKRLDAIEHLTITNPYQPPPSTAKWLNYEEGEIDPCHIDIDTDKLKYADLEPQDMAANREANH